MARNRVLPQETFLGFTESQEESRLDESLDKRGRLASRQQYADADESSLHD